MQDPFDDEPGTVLRVTLPDDAPPRLDKALAAAVPEEAALSRSRLMRMIEEGAVSRGGAVVRDPKARAAGRGMADPAGTRRRGRTAPRGHSAGGGL
jgi:hypothetical protein